MNKQQPMLMESPLTKRVFVVTSYEDNGDGTFTARQKYDVTEQFDALVAKRGGGECEIVYHYEARNRSEIGREPVELSCGHIVERHSKYCPECGRKIRKAVKR